MLKRENHIQKYVKSCTETYPLLNIMLVAVKPRVRLKIIQEVVARQISMIAKNLQ